MENNKPIQIKRSKNADTRTCDWKNVDKETLKQDSLQHINDVRKGMQYLADQLVFAGCQHDHTKINDLDYFHECFKTGFKDDGWFINHQKTERHHLKKEEYIQGDVNLIDVIEMIVDCVMAGLARSGEFREEPIPEGLLQKAYENTIQLMLGKVEVVTNDVEKMEEKNTETKNKTE